MEWRDRIVSNPDILVGKPSVKGTRLSVELILGWLAGERLDARDDSRRLSTARAGRHPRGIGIRGRDDARRVICGYRQRSGVIVRAL